MKKNTILLLIIFLLIIISVFILEIYDKKNKNKINLNISVSSSMQNVLEEIKYIYEKENKNVNIVFNFAGAGTLQKQIEHGAPVDIFISASNKQLNKLKEKNLVFNNLISKIATNKMVLITNKNNKTISNWNELKYDLVSKIGIGEIESVPAGMYGKEILISLKIYDYVKNKLIFAKNVREVLSWVESNNVDVGIVYLTDAKKSNKIRIIKEAPKNTCKKINCCISIIKDSKKINESEKFLKFIKKNKTIRIFKKHGFSDIN